MDKKTKIIVALLAVAAVVFCAGLFTTGERRFDFDSLPADYTLQVERLDTQINVFEDGRHRSETRIYTLDNDTAQQTVQFLKETKLRKRVNFNLYWLIPGVKRIDSVSTSDNLNYRFIFTDSSGKEIMHLYTHGCDYIQSTDENSRWVKIRSDRDFEQSIEAILATVADYTTEMT
ncbi:MAG: hypothetical protein IKV52_01210 [Oscillospiraceae bacterium]|nr:hypothetical protein [Oscillospiraceae bacterium]